MEQTVRRKGGKILRHYMDHMEGPPYGPYSALASFLLSTYGIVHKYKYILCPMVAL